MQGIYQSKTQRKIVTDNCAVTGTLKLLSYCVDPPGICSERSPPPFCVAIRRLYKTSRASSISTRVTTDPFCGQPAQRLDRYTRVAFEDPAGERQKKFCVLLARWQVTASSMHGRGWSEMEARRKLQFAGPTTPTFCGHIVVSRESVSTARITDTDGRRSTSRCRNTTRTGRRMTDCIVLNAV